MCTQQKRGGGKGERGRQKDGGGRERERKGEGIERDMDIQWFDITFGEPIKTHTCPSTSQTIVGY